MDTTSRIISGLRLTVILIGLIGNVIIWIVYSRPVFKKNSISVYCRALAVIESFTIVNLIYEYGTTFFNYFLGNFSSFFCILFYYFGIAFGAMPGWILIAFSIDKLLNMTKNKGNWLIMKRSFQYLVIATIVLVHLLLYVEIPIYLRLGIPMTNATNMTTLWICGSSSLPFATFITGSNLVEGSLVPFLIMFTTSIISIGLIRKSSKHVGTMLVWRNRRDKRDIRFAITSITFNSLFIILRLPFIVYVVFMSLIPGLSPTSLGAGLSYLVYFVNHSIGIIVHLVSNNLFRKEFCKFLSLKDSHE